MTLRQLRVAFDPGDVELAKELPIESFRLLLRAWRYAQSTGLPWREFALSWRALRQAGLTECDLRWLSAKGYLEHFPADAPRGPRLRLAAAARQPFSSGSAFWLTRGGTCLAQTLLQAAAIPSAALQAAPCIPELESQVPSSAPSGSLPPLWNAGRRELSVGRVLVKRFNVPAVNQEIILSCFQEESWPEHIDDPLPPADGLDAKRRLHSTIQCLNRNQKAPLLRFHGDGYGRGICWSS